MASLNDINNNPFVLINNVVQTPGADFEVVDTSENKINFLIRQNYKKSLNYSEISHAKNLKKIFKIYEKK